MHSPATTAVSAARETQSAGAVLMVRPAGFGFNPETASSNAFQAPGGIDTHDSESQGRALREFDALAAGLQRAGVDVIVGADSLAPLKPDALFPNNWVSFHRDGTVVLYPMLAPNRRLERRLELLDRVRAAGYQPGAIVDLSHRELEQKFLEGTGSLVLDRVNRLAYAALSPRTDRDVLGEFAQRLGYELVTFEALDGSARPIYHTNVMMAVGTHCAVVCAATIADDTHRTAVNERLRATGHEVVEISPAQMLQFAGNVLELAPAVGRLLAMSRTAWNSLDAAQRRRLEAHAGVLVADIPTIERVGGGGVRCMLAEIHLPKRGSALVS